MEKISFKWHPLSVLNIDSSNSLYACTITNQPILFDSITFQKLWNNAKLRVLIDGGANRWLEFIEKNDLLDNLEKPSLVTGDMDSITEESIKRLTEMNVKFFNTPDQDYTDLEKALQIIHHQNIEKVLIISEHSGRIDQILSQINMLLKTQLDELYLLSHDTLAWILRPGIHHLQVPEHFVKQQIWCSYVPFGSACCVTTRGLKYDLTDGVVSFGGLISSSNTYDKSTVEIECDHALFWAMGTSKES